MNDDTIVKTGWSRRSKLLAGAAAGLIALGAVGGVAQAMRGQHGHGAMMADMAERYDANKDGKISQEEIDTNRANWHGEFDKDKSGGLSLDEFSALWLKARHEQMVREYQDFDRDGDGKVSMDEYKGPLKGAVAEMDENGDGMLSGEDHRGRKGGMRHHGGGMMDGSKDDGPPADGQPAQ